MKPITDEQKIMLMNECVLPSASDIRPSVTAEYLVEILNTYLNSEDGRKDSVELRSEKVYVVGIVTRLFNLLDGWTWE